MSQDEDHGAARDLSVYSWNNDGDGLIYMGGLVPCQWKLSCNIGRPVCWCYWCAVIAARSAIFDGLDGGPPVWLIGGEKECWIERLVLDLGFFGNKTGATYLIWSPTCVIDR